MIYKFPKKAKRVFKGVIFDVYQWKQKMFDGSTKTFEVAKRQDTVVIIATVKDKIILLKQKQPNTGWFYDLPSGRMDVPGEKPKNAALRELLEETGYKPKTIKPWKTITHGSAKVFNNVYFFLARDCKKVTGQKLDEGEKIQVMEVGFDWFLKMADLKNAYFGPDFTVEMLQARLDKKVYQDLKKSIFS